MFARKLFLTGEPGVGKTTVLGTCVEKLGKDCVGFYTTEQRSDKGRQGFNIETVNLPVPGGPLAHVDFKTGMHVGKYQVDTTDLNRIITCEELFDENKILIIDEIGQMQSFSEGYKQFIEKVLSCPKQSLIATIKKSPNPWTDAIKNNFPDIQIAEITEKNRGYMPKEICRYMLVG